MRSRTLLTQVLAVNAVLVAVTAAISAVLGSAQIADAAGMPSVATLGVAVLAVILLNSLLLRPRLEPLERDDVRSRGGHLHAASELLCGVGRKGAAG